MRIRALLCSLALLAGVATTVTSVVRAQLVDRCCLPARTVPPPAALCVTPCHTPPGTQTCNPNVLPGGWVNGGCVQSPTLLCFPYVAIVKIPIYRCRLRRCLIQGALGDECYWQRAGFVPNQPVIVNSCFGNRC